VKIDTSSKPVGGSSTPSGAGRARAGSSGGTATAAGSASSAASGGASTEATLSGLQSVSSVLASSPVMDSARVAEIKQAIAEGRFQVNPERIADGLLKSVRDMLGSER